MTSRFWQASICVLSGLIACQSGATCLNRENTSLQETTPTSAFSLLPDGTLASTATGLMWKRCLEGQELADDACQGEPTRYTWADALNAAQGASYAGHADWRIPNPKELLTIYEDRCAEPALNADLFPISAVFALWTSTPTALHDQDTFFDVWQLDYNGLVWHLTAIEQIHVLLVRDLP